MAKRYDIMEYKSSQGSCIDVIYKKYPDFIFAEESERMKIAYHYKGTYRIPFGKNNDIKVLTNPILRPIRRLNKEIIMGINVYEIFVFGGSPMAPVDIFMRHHFNFPLSQVKANKEMFSKVLSDNQKQAYIKLSKRTFFDWVSVYNK